MVLATPGFQNTTNLTFQFFVSPEPILPTTTNTRADSTLLIAIIVSIGGIILIGVVVLTIWCVKQNRTKKSKNKGIAIKL